jgi:4-amino-4-deoxy-L-arabinose transferase-like glycosyltransferase
MSSADPALGAAVRASDARAIFSSRRVDFPNFVDLLVYAFLLAAGAFFLYFRLRAHDFQHDDVFYFQRAISILHLGYDGFNGTPETSQPPGLPYLFAGFCLLGGCSYAVVLGSMAVFETLGLAVTYTLFRRETSQIVAIAICVLLVTFPLGFQLATEWVANAFPVFFTSMSALLVTARLDEAASRGARLRWGVLLAVLVACSVMIASATLSLLGAVVAKIASTFFRDRRLALKQLKNYAAVLLLGIAVQGLWTHRKPMPIEWPIQGFPRPYLQQLPLKSGPNPELGYATWRDVIVRVETNLKEEASLLLQLLYPGWINLALPSVAVTAPILLILLGLGDSLWRARGDTLAEWYFAAYQVIYLLWPWKLEVRYFLPVAPLALLYLWRGAEALLALAKNRPRILGAVWLPASAVLAAANWLWLRQVAGAASASHGSMQPKLSLAFWCFSGILALWIAWKSSAWQRFLSILLEWCSRPLGSLRFSPLHVAGAACGIFVAFMAASGFAAELRIGRQNLDLHSAVNRTPPDAEAALWLRSHTPSDAILMSREIPTVSYLSGRKVIWLPPSGDPRLLIEGIRKYKVDYISVIKRKDSYFLPPDDDSMAALLASYPSAFRPVAQTPEVRIFQVLKDNLPANSQGNFSTIEH